jgi:DNA-binding response OmpR family regulator
VEPYEIAQAAQLVVGPPSQGLSDIIDLGVVKIDLRAHDVEVEGERKVLPPKEFEILVQLALRSGTPLDATELLGRVWDASDSATVNDLHTRIWRLRRLIGDHGRRRPLIVNRRGYGYLLSVPQQDDLKVGL